MRVSLNAPFGARCFMTATVAAIRGGVREDVLMHRLALGAL